MKTLKHEIYDHKHWKKRVLLKLLQKKQMRGRFAREFFFQEVQSESPIEKKPLEDLLNGAPSIRLENFISRNGNLTPYEVMVMSCLIASFKPLRILEIGTFDGNTTLQMAVNATEDSFIHTIDLPPGSSETKEPVLDSDIQFIQDKKKNRRKFEGTKWASKIQQHLGDSTSYDFSSFAKEGSLDFIFIDGGHSYPCVKSDTENALKILSQGGVILWHDYTPLYGGVFTYLLELSKELPLTHIEGTNFVIMQEG